jgi:ATP-dependent Clp protease ATP-binding subunit ClpA
VFERFTKAARVAVVTAQDEARTLAHDHIGAEHVLLGLLGTPSVAERLLTRSGADLATVRELVARQAGPDDAEVLKSLGIDLDEVRRKAEESFGPGALDRAPRRRRLFGRNLPASHIPFHRSGKKVLEDSLKIALSLRHNYIGTEHMLLAILDRPEGVAAATLRAAGVTLDRETATQLVLTEIRRSA